jgi:hypothetical protein
VERPGEALETGHRPGASAGSSSVERSCSQELVTSTVESIFARPKVRSIYSDGTTIYSFWRRAIKISITNAALLPGDSGTAIVTTQEKHVMGLLFNMGLIYAYACPLV